MITKDYLPPNTPIVSNFLVLDNLTAFVAFVQTTLDGQIVKECKDAQGNYINVSLRIENAIITAQQKSDTRQPTTSSLLMYVADIETVIANAVKQNATLKQQPETNTEGERLACIQDQWGNLWWLACALAN